MRGNTSNSSPLPRYVLPYATVNIYSKLMNNYKSTTKSMETHETITYSL